MIKIGIIGCGKIAQTRHIPEYIDNPDCEIAAYFDFNTQRADELAEKYGGKAYNSAEKLLKDTSIDAVSICVANNAHAETTVAALKAGKHVLCEKPMATNIEDCVKMVNAADDAGKILMIDQNQRLAKAHIKAKELIDSNEIGTVISFRTTFGHSGPETWSVDPGMNSWFFDKRKAQMGAMADLGVHKTDLIQYLISQRVVETTAKVVTLDKRTSDGNLIGVDDNAFCIYKMCGGAVGTMNASWTFYGDEDNSTIIYGSKGVLRIYDNPDFSLELIKRNGERIYYDIDRIQTNDNQTKSGIIDMFVNAIKDNNSPYIAGRDVLNAMKAVFASIESSQTGRSVSIE